MSAPHGYRKFKVLAAITALLGVAAIAIKFSLPAIARWQIKSVLMKAGYDDPTFTVDFATPFGVGIRDLQAGTNGALKISSARIDYAPLRALTGKIDAIRLDHASITLNLDATQSSEAQRHFDIWASANSNGLPLWRVELSDCAVTLMRGDLNYTVHADGWLWREQLHDRARISLTLHAGENESAAGWLEGHVAFAAHQFDCSAGAKNVDLAHLLPFLPASVGAQVKQAGGLVNVVATVVDEKGNTQTQGNIELQNGSVTTANNPAITIEGAMSKVSFASLNPLRTDVGQTLDVKKLLIGDNQLADIHVEFDVDRRGLQPATDQSSPLAIPSHVRFSALRFTWAGGEIVSSDPVYVRPIDKAISLKLDISHVDLNAFLKLVSTGRVSGKGSLSGHLVAKVTWPTVEFGTGKIVSDAPGEINFGAQMSELASTIAQKDPRLGGQQQQIMDALASFHYDQIVFEFQRTDAGLAVTTQISGRGTRGLTTPINLSVRYVGLEEALNAYLRTSLRVNSGGK